jgi:GGDEF domain-containing protein
MPRERAPQGLGNAPYVERAVGRLAPLVPACLGAVLACLALTHLVAFTGMGGVYITVVGGTLGLFLVLGALRSRGRPMRSAPAHALVVACLLLGAADVLVWTRVTGGLDRTGELVLVLAACGAAVLDVRWLLPTVGVLVGAWGAVALTLAPAQRPFHAVACAVGLVLCTVVRRGCRAALGALTEVHAAAELAVLDPLTGLVDRRGLALLGEKLVAIARRESGAVGATAVELPGLEAVRRAAGGQAADDLVVHVAGVLQAVTRGTDVVARWDDDHFMLVTHGHGAPFDVLEGRIARIIEVGCPVPASVWPRTLLFGRAVLQPWDDMGLPGLLAAGEADLYERTGRPAPQASVEAAAALAAEAEVARRRRGQAERGQSASEIVAAAHEVVSESAQPVDVTAQLPGGVVDRPRDQGD